MATNKRQFTLRLQEENFLKIKAIAEADRRSIAMEIEYILEQYIKNYEKNNGTVQVNKL
ncbi:Arc family DNA-binding protein [Megamonas hypermegale]|uniref:Arc family DNA-binding protein n=1 Tax=Megamonas hypermegale TaxID=158847 RepID=UPI0026F0C559|nr:Arc family DNA-binding protein [Megamonas hypermegale]